MYSLLIYTIHSHNPLNRYKSLYSHTFRKGMSSVVEPHLVFLLFYCLLQYWTGTNSVLAGLNGARPTTGVIARHFYMRPTTTIHISVACDTTPQDADLRPPNMSDQQPWI